MNAPKLLDVLDKLGQPNVLVVGDLILDLYTWGDAERISQEAPVILLRADRREKRLGGAANVCQMLRGLEANVMCAGIVGRDEAGQWVIDSLAEAGVECEALLTDAGRPTTTKERFIGRAEGRHPHQILRVDNEVRRAMADDLESQLIELVCNKLSTADVVLVSDYGKGVCSPSLLRAVIDTARQHGVPVVVDPIKAKNFSVYRGATAITPNRSEAEVATDSKIKSSADASAAAERIVEQADLQAGFITLDRDGMALARRGEPTEIFSTRPRAVYDITGAGDIVLATIGICTAAG
ncbi:MAG: PfkB family carbohydrate kinase, partial [Planctomycetota bacterium]|nr:PfkB family carbohydrate kinase [Planctomycetota bacterium]